MARRVVYGGARFTIVFAVERSGASPAGEFFDELGISDRAKLMALFKLVAETGKCHNREKFGVLGEGLCEFKSFQIRMPFAYSRSERGVIVVTHGFMKKRDKAPKEEIERAWRIFEEDQARGKLALVRKAKG